MKWNYHDIYKQYDMEGDLHIGTGVVRVHDIFDATPDFLKTADVVFCDPPCNIGNLRSFYTKAEIEERTAQYLAFQKRFFAVVDEISPRLVFVEVFKSNKDAFAAELGVRYKNLKTFECTYYRKASNKCWIIMASNEPLPDIDLTMDEEDAIEKICKDVSFDCIADPCIGKGLVGYYANRYGKKFVGTELNKQRLAVCVKRVLENQRGNIN